MNQSPDPITFAVDYPERPLDRLSTLLRAFFAIPIWILLASVSGATWRWTAEDRMTVAGADGGVVLLSAGGLLFLNRGAEMAGSADAETERSRR